MLLLSLLIGCAHVEIPYDGIDQDRDGHDLIDVDGDGHASLLVGGGDCDDRRPWVHPGAEDLPEDGVDADCDGDDPEFSEEAPTLSNAD